MQEKSYTAFEKQEDINELLQLREEVDDVLSMDDDDIQRLAMMNPGDVNALMKSGYLMLKGFINSYLKNLQGDDYIEY